MQKLCCVRSAGMHARAALVVLATTVTLTAACSGDDDDAGPITYPVETSPPVVSSTTPPSMSMPIATSTSTSTATSTIVMSSAPPTTVPAPVTTAPATTQPGPTLVTPEQIAEAQALDRQLAIDVERDWRTAEKLFREAEMNPADPTALERVLRYVTPEWGGRVRSVLAALNQANQRILREPLVEPTLIVETAPFPVAGTSDQVTITVCEVDPWVIVESGTGPEGADTVLRSRVLASRNEVRLRLSADGIWQVARVDLVQQFEGSSTCSG